MGEITVSKSQNNSAIRFRLGNTVVVQLAEMPTTGFRWATLGKAGGVVALAEERFVLDSGTAPGGGGTRTFKFLAVRSGSGVLELKLCRDWEGEQSVTERFSVSVTVI
ncbi:MAG: protease inhibitor I42 family protein [Acidobacteriota bacterium]|jgi:inhibitor of cysteine peptidase